MQHLTLTPFGRQPITAGLLASRLSAADLPPAPPAPGPVDKWAVFNDLRTVRAQYRLTDRDLAVLYALLTFLPAKGLAEDADLVVFPSNATLSDRAHGMAESTLRRHLAALVASGLIWRQDSPNGKRYAARDRSGAMVHAFGFDLCPLLQHAADIAARAEAEHAAALTLTRAREALVLRLRDAAKLLAYGRDEALPGDWAALEARLLPLRAALRRRMDMGTVSGLLAQAEQTLSAIHTALHLVPDAGVAPVETEQMESHESENTNASAAHIGRHHANSKQDYSESEPCPEKGRAQTNPSIPLALVLKACPDIIPYARSNLASWHDLITTASEVRGMMGISASAWHEAVQLMGPEVAAITVAAMLQRFTAIANPGGYLRSLSGRAASATFSPGPMIMALLNTTERRAA